jgi:hypothetical protein
MKQKNSQKHVKMRMRRSSSSELVNLYPVVCMESNCCAFSFLGLPNLSFCKLFTETFNGRGEVMGIR